MCFERCRDTPLPLSNDRSEIVGNRAFRDVERGKRSLRAVTPARVKLMPPAWLGRVVRDDALWRRRPLTRAGRMSGAACACHSSARREESQRIGPTPPGDRRERHHPYADSCRRRDCALRRIGRLRDALRSARQPDLPLAVGTGQPARRRLLESAPSDPSAGEPIVPAVAAAEPVRFQRPVTLLVPRRAGAASADAAARRR